MAGDPPCPECLGKGYVIVEERGIVSRLIHCGALPKVPASAIGRGRR